MSEHPGVARARQYLSTFQQGDFDSLEDFFTDDVLWHVGGNHGLSGDYRGKESLFGYFRKVNEITGGGIKLDPEAIMASDRHVAMFLRVTGARDGRQLDVSMAEMVKVHPDGRWSEFWAMADDQDAVDRFWA
jgi:uncharacterized protein